jgi:hypothetical protein
MNNRRVYMTWGHDTLIDALVQAEADLKALRAELKEAEEEREQYYQESRDSARTLGGIIKLLRDEDLELPGDSALRGVAQRPQRFGRAVGPEVVHRYDKEGSSSPYHLCVCGNQWLTQSGRCVAEGPKL